MMRLRLFAKAGRVVDDWGSKMNDNDLWPVHIIFFGFLIALVLSALKLMFEEVLQSPIMLLLIVLVLGGIWLIRKRG